MIPIVDYVTIPHVDVKRGFALGVATLSALPEDAAPPVQAAARDVHAATRALQADWAARTAVEAQDRRPIDLRNDRAWGSLARTLEGTASLPTERGQLAARLHQKLFDDGTGFLQLSYEKQWAEGERRLELIAKEELDSALTRATGGPEHLDEVRASHRSYGEVLHITEPAEQRALVNLNESLAKLRAALSAYTLQLVAWGNQTEANEAAARAALEPLDTARSEEAASRAGQTPTEPDVTPETPVPPVP